MPRDNVITTPGPRKTAAQNFVSNVRSATGDLELVAAPPAPQQIVIDLIILNNETANANLVLLKRGGVTFFRWQSAAAIGSTGPLAIAIPLGQGQNLAINDSTVNAVGYTVWYHYEDVAQ